MQREAPLLMFPVRVFDTSNEKNPPIWRVVGYTVMAMATAATMMRGRGLLLGYSVFASVAALSVLIPQVGAVLLSF